MLKYTAPLNQIIDPTLCNLLVKKEEEPITGLWITEVSKDMPQADSQYAVSYKGAEYPGKMYGLLIMKIESTLS